MASRTSRGSWRVPRLRLFIPLVGLAGLERDVGVCRECSGGLRGGSAKVMGFCGAGWSIEQG